MTDENITVKYLKNLDICPFCSSDNITGGFSEFEETDCYRQVICKDCKRVWTQYFEMRNIEEC